jgi:hypothetical protein
MRRLVAIFVVMFLLAACGGSKPNLPPLTQRQHDSVIGASGLPGASGIRGAMRVVDSSKARNARLDSVRP